MTAPRLDWGDPSAVQAWARDLRAHIEDGLQAGFDATAPPAHRMLGRRAVREQLADAERSVEAAFAFAGFGDDETGGGR